MSHMRSNSTTTVYNIGKYDAAKMTVQGFNTDPDTAKFWWAMKHELLPKFAAARPNPAHSFLGQLHRMGKLQTVVTQNVDGLHQQGGVPADKVVELHGNMRGLICSRNPTILNPLPYPGEGSCAYRCSHEEALESSYHAGVALPLCPLCGEAPLRTETVMFGQPMPAEELVAARAAVAAADLLLIVGSTLIVEPANSLPAQAMLQGTPVVMVNFDETKFDDHCCTVVRRPAGVFLGAVAERMRCPS